jgi:hypothetical protein
MDAETAAEIEAMRSLPVKELRRRYHELFGWETRSSNKPFLFRRIAWRLQVIAAGDITERVRKRALALANDADLKIRPDRSFRNYSIEQKPRDWRLPSAGTVLRREWEGQRIEVTVQEDDFEYQGRRYPSLSTIATKVTGVRWNGFVFFELARRKEASRG